MYHSNVYFHCPLELDRALVTGRAISVRNHRVTVAYMKQYSLLYWTVYFVFFPKTKLKY